MRNRSAGKIDTILIMASFAIFAASMLLTLLFGAGIYKTIADASQDGYGERACLSYIWTKVKTGDAAGKVYAGEFCGLPALYLEEEYDGYTYITTIYAYDGWVRELFSEEGLEFLPEDGTPVIEAESLAFEQLPDGLIKAYVNSQSMYVYPRSK